MRHFDVTLTVYSKSIPDEIGKELDSEWSTRSSQPNRLL